MKIEATREDILTLLELTEIDARAEPVAAPAQARARDAAERRLPGDLLTRYRWLRAVGRYPTMVAVEQETCSGCHVRLATMIVDGLKRSIGIYACPRCRRMLYAPALLSKGAAEEAVESKAPSGRSPRQGSAPRS